MARETEVKVDKALEAIEKLQYQMAQVMTAISILTDQNGAVVEGDDIEPKAARNGKIRKAHR